jgi:hypothetical protein
LNFYDTLKTAIAFPVIIVAALILLLQLGRWQGFSFPKVFIYETSSTHILHLHFCIFSVVGCTSRGKPSSTVECKAKLLCLCWPLFGQNFTISLSLFLYRCIHCQASLAPMRWYNQHFSLAGLAGLPLHASRGRQLYRSGVGVCISCCETGQCSKGNSVPLVPQQHVVVKNVTAWRQNVLLMLSSTSYLWVTWATGVLQHFI